MNFNQSTKQVKVNRDCFDAEYNLDGKPMRVFICGLGMDEQIIIALSDGVTERRACLTLHELRLALLPVVEDLILRTLPGATAA